MVLHWGLLVPLIFSMIGSCRSYCDIKELNVNKVKHFRQIVEKMEGLPVKLTGVMDKWESKAWTQDDMLKVLGELKVWPRNLHKGGLRASRTRSTPLNKFLLEPKSGLSITEIFFSAADRALNGTYKVPKVLKTAVYEYPVLGIGVEGSGSAWYQDDMMFAAQILGSTKWQVLPRNTKPGKEDKTCGAHHKVPKKTISCIVKKGEVILIPQEVFRSWCTEVEEASLFFGFRGAGEDPFPAWVRKGLIATTENDLEALGKALASRPDSSTDTDKAMFLSACLNAAMQSGHTMILEKLEKLGADFDEEDQNGQGHLHNAAMSGQVTSVKFAVKRAADMRQQRSPDGYTAMHLAALQGHTEVVEFLGKQGKKVWSVKDKNGYAPMHMAVNEGHTAAITAMVQSKVDIEDADAKGLRPLHFALLKASDASVISHMLNLKANIDGGDKTGMTPLHHAAASKNLDMATLLLENGANIEAKDNDGRRPVHIAALQGQEELLQLLHSHGAELEQKDNQGFNPEGLAVAQGHASIMAYIRGDSSSIDAAPSIRAAMIKNDLKMLTKALKGKKEYLTEKDEYDFTLAHKSVLSGHLPILEYLVGRGVDLQAKTSWGAGTMHLAAKQGHTEVVEYLEKQDVDVNEPDFNGTTPMLLAAADGHTKIINVLVDLGAQIDVKDNNKMTPLLSAAENKRRKVVDALLKKGATPYLVNKDGRGVSQSVAAMSDTKTMKILLDNGVDIQFVDDSELPASHVAAVSGHIPMMKLLVEKRTDVNLKAGEENLHVLHMSVQGGHIPMLDYLFKEVGLKKDEKTQELIDEQEPKWIEELERKLISAPEQKKDDAYRRKEMVRELSQDPDLNKRLDYLKKQYERLNPEERQYLKEALVLQKEQQDGMQKQSHEEAARAKSKPVVEL